MWILYLSVTVVPIAVLKTKIFGVFTCINGSNLSYFLTFEKFADKKQLFIKNDNVGEIISAIVFNTAIGTTDVLQFYF